MEDDTVRWGEVVEVFGGDSRADRGYIHTETWFTIEPGMEMT